MRTDAKTEEKRSPTDHPCARLPTIEESRRGAWAVQQQSICQSCGMPLQNLADVGTEADGAPSLEYCRYCYDAGAFTNPHMTLDEMLELATRGWVKADPGIAEEVARSKLSNLIPNLKRWQS